MSKPSILVIGTGYVGLTCAACFANQGFKVTGLDIDEDKVQLLSSGTSPIFEPGLDELLTAGLESGLLEFTTSADAASTADVVFLCLPTPPLPTGTPDISILRGAVMQHREALKSGAAVVTKSTVPLGTSKDVAAWLDRDDVHLVSNPEFLREGSAIHDFLNPDRVVVGSLNHDAALVVQSLYDGLPGERILCDPLSAELIKYAANAFLATKLSFVNELARICDEVGGDVDAVTYGIGTDHRIADSFLTPGPGWGGSCFPKDVAGLAALARSSRLRVPVIESAVESNRDHFDHVITQIRKHVGKSLQGANVAMWGIAFKAGTDDTRSSPALDIAERLTAEQCDVRAADPVAKVDGNLFTQMDMYDACTDADLLVIATEWDEFRDADLAQVADRLSQPTILDLRGIISPEAAAEHGLTVHSLGRP